MPPATWQTHQFWAMGCQMAVWLEAEPDVAAQAFADVAALFAAHEQTLSRFRPDSELSRLNGRSGQWVVVADVLWDVLTLALGMAALTDGRFDPTLINGMLHAGYRDSFENVARGMGNDSWSTAALLTGQWADVQLDETRRAICLPPGVGVDLGGIAKGYTAQTAVAHLRASGPCLVDAGGDLAVGAAPQGYPGWPVAISAPWSGAGAARPDLASFWLAEAALATSGIDYRRWQHNGRLAHHLLDPTTGQPVVTDALTVTILAEDAAQAEAWATATLVAGSADGLAALLEMELAGLMVTDDGRILVTPPMYAVLQGSPADMA
ncbi:MAG: FAD:protein FMN transferase [Chloroflexi bacterium]|nr:FAD:protein FMN transferase [Chloroflexota bacterium]